MAYILSLGKKNIQNNTKSLRIHIQVGSIENREDNITCDIILNNAYAFDQSHIHQENKVAYRLVK